MLNTVKVPTVLLTVLFAIAMPSFALAQTWNGGGDPDQNWSNGANWGGTAPTDGPFSILNFGGTINLNTINNIPGGSGGFNVNDITFLAGAGAFTISGTSMDMLGLQSNTGDTSDITNNSTNLQTINSVLIARPDFTTALVLNAAAGDIRLNGAINQNGGAGVVRKEGVNTVTLTGSSNYTGATTVNAGTLALINSAVLDSSSITVNNGGTLRIATTTGSIDDATDVTVNTGGTFEMNEPAEYINGLNGGGTVTRTVAGNGVLRVGEAGGNGNFSGNITDGAGTLEIHKAGAGTQTLSGGANSYSGGTQVLGGTLRIEDETGTLPGSVVVNAPGTLQLQSSDTNWTNPITGTGTVNLEFAAGPGNTALSGISGFNGTVETTTTAVTGDKWRVNNLNAPNVDAVINPGTQLYVVGNNTLNSVQIEGTGNSENRGAIRFGGTLNSDVTLVGDATIGAEGGVLNGNVSTGAAGNHTLRVGTAPTNNMPNNMFNGVISDGTGTLALEIFNTNSGSTFIHGNAANTYSGGTTLLDGGGSGTRLRIAGISGTPYGTGAITIGEAATDNAGIYMVTSNQTLTNDLVFNTRLGTDRPGLRADATNITLSGDITANLADATFSTNNTGSFNLTGQITGDEGLRLHNQFGSSITVNLNNTGTANDYQGDTTIEGAKGTINLLASNQLPNGLTAGNLVNNGTFNMNGFDETINGLSGTGVVDSVSGMSTLTLGDGNATSTFSGTLVNSGGTLSVTKIGSGVATFSGANTYTGTTEINGGTLRLSQSGNPATVLTNTINVNGGGTLAFGSFNQLGQNAGTGFTPVVVHAGGVVDSSNTVTTFENLTLSNGVLISNGGFNGDWGSFALLDTLTVTATSSILNGGGGNNFDFITPGQFNGNQDLEINVSAGATLTNDLSLRDYTPTGNTYAITKTGDGTAIFTANNTYSGVTSINDGVLRLTGAGTLGDTTGTTTIANGAALELGAGVNTAENITFTGSGVPGTDGAIRSVDGSSTITGDLSAVGSGFHRIVSTSGTFTVGDIDVADGTLVLQGNGIINGDITGGRELIRSANDAGTWIISGANNGSSTTKISNGTLQIGNGGTTGELGTGTVTNDSTLIFNRTNTISVSNTITGSGNVIQNGSGILTLTGNNSYAGGTTINDGTLRYDTDAALGATPGSFDSDNIVINSGIFKNNGPSVTLHQNRGIIVNASDSRFDVRGGTEVNVQGVVSGSGNLSKHDTGKLILSNNNTYAGTTTITTGSLQIGDGGTTGTLGVGNVTNNAALIFDRSNNHTVFNNISGSGSVTKNGSGTLTITGTNTYSGTTNITAGTFVAGDTSALGSTAGGTTISGGGTLDINGQNLRGEAITVSGAGVGGNGAIVNNGGSQSNALDNVTLSDNATIGGTSRWDLRGTSAFGGMLDLGGNTLTKTGNNKIAIVDSTMTSAGDIDIEQGTFSFTRSNISGAGSVNAMSGTLLEFENYSTGSFDKAITLDNAEVQLNGSSLALGNNATIDLTNSNEFDVNSNLTLTVNGVVSGSGSIEKTDNGTLRLAGNNTYTGATNVTDGTLTVTGDISSSSLTTVSSGATLNGNGTVGDLVNNGTFAPGLSIDIMNTGSYTENGTLEIEIDNSFTGGNPTTAGTDYDQVNVTGTVTLNSATATLDVQAFANGGGFDPDNGTVFTIINNDGSDSVSGTFNGLAAGDIAGTIGTTNLHIFYNGENLEGGGDGFLNDVVLVAADGAAAALYVDDQFTAPMAVDGNQETAAVESAYVGIDAFSTTDAAFASQTAATFNGTLTLNGNSTTYDVNLDHANAGGVTVNLVADSDETVNNVTIGTLLGSAGDTINLNAEGNGNGNLTVEDGNFSGNIDGDGTVTKSTSGSLTLSGNNGYTGATSVSAGELVVGSDTALGTSAGSTTVANNARVVLANGVNVADESITITGHGGNFNGALQAAAGASAEWGGDVILNTGARVGSGIGGTLNISGDIQNGTETNLTIGAGDGGTGTVVISGTNNTYTGNTNIVRGTLQLGATNALPTGTVLNVDSTSAAEDSIFDLNANDQSIAGLASTGAGSGAGGSLVTNSNAGASTLTINNSGNFSFGGVVENGTGGVNLVKTGAGMQTFTNDVTVTDLTVDGPMVFGNDAGDTLTVTGTTEIGRNGTTGTLTANDGTVNIGDGSGDFYLGHRTNGSGSPSQGTADFTNADSVTINVDLLSLGENDGSNAGTTEGILRLSNTANTVTANTILMGDSGLNGNTSVTSEIVLGAGTNDFEVGTFLVAGRKSNATVSINAGGSFNLEGAGGAGTGLLDLSRRTTSTGTNTTGTLDLADASSVTIDIDTIRLGTFSSGAGSGSGDSRGVWNFSNTTNDISADEIIVGDSPSGANTDVFSEITLGSGSNNVNVDTWTVGGRKSQGRVTINSGGTLTLAGNDNAAADVRIGFNDAAGTGTDSVGVVDLSGGTFNATIGNLEIGQHPSGSGSGTGTLIMDAGTVTADQIIQGQGTNATGTFVQNGGSVTVANGVSDGGGTTTVRVDGGTMTVNAGGFSADTARVGHNVKTGTLNVDGGAVRIGTGTENFDVGRRDSNSGFTQGTADFADASSVTINVDEMRLGTASTGGGGAKGVVTLSTAGANTITANSIQLGDTNSGDNVSASRTSELHLGGSTNTINADSFTVGDRKSSGLVDIAAGGSLTLRGTNGTDRSDLRIGFNTSGTGTNPAESFVNLNGAGDVDALVGELTIGRHGSSSGSGKGRLDIDTGTLDVNSLTLGLANAAGTSDNPLNTTGIMNVAGDVAIDVNDEFSIGNGGTGTINQTGGTIVVHNPTNAIIGDSGVGNYNLTGDGAGVELTVENNLQLGVDDGTGTFTQTTGQVDVGSRLEIGRSGSGSGQYTISGDGSLSVDLALRVGFDAEGRLDIDGGTINSNVSTGNTVVGFGSGAGIVDMTAGTFNIGGDLEIARDSNGTFTQTGGDTLVNNNFQVGGPTGQAGTTASVTLSGGTQTVQENIDVGVYAGTGDFTLTGTGLLSGADSANDNTSGTAQALTGPASTLNIGANGTFNFHGGTLEDVSFVDPDPVGSGGTFTQEGGRFVIGSDLADPANLGNMNSGSSIDAVRFTTTVQGDLVVNGDNGIGGDDPGTLVFDIFGLGAIVSGEGTTNLSDGSTSNPLTLVTDSDLLLVEGTVDLQDAIVEANWLFDPYENPLQFYDILYATEGFVGTDFTLAGDATMFRIVDDGMGGQFLQVAAPEPATIVIWTLIGTALFGGAAWRRRRFKVAA